MSELEGEELRLYHRLLRQDPERCLDMVNKHIEADPANSHNYFSRHQLWQCLGRFDLALQDLDTSISLGGNFVNFDCRGWLLCEMGQYEEALVDFNRAQAMDPQMWKEGLGPRLRANCHACLGNVAAALADCANLPDDFFLPPLRGMPGGNKEAYTAEIRRRAREVAARRRSKRGRGPTTSGLRPLTRRSPIR